ncbi:stalk domain-containing protein [Ammoniphilus sp. CFH 90114]|uniref:C40 family peptidase n=1 Tax=Ammoniphilus sp. CFH 90114 TaxID=2493665 RepID=UPI001010085B|nr:stalk domain-containing protein [Ammoniphilus sp. CFH 90114]RXT15332.1 hypothetical protein EIZ39_03765 [Ammoniphilus sp. CFH 90114]
MLHQKLLFIVLLISALLTTESVAHGTTRLQSNVQVNVNGQLIEFPDARPFINRSNRTLVPVRFISEHLGYAVTWNDQNQNIRLRNDSQDLIFRIGQYESVIVDSRTFVPLRYVADAFDAEVHWNEELRVATVMTEELIHEPTSPVDEPLTEDIPEEPLSTAKPSDMGWKKKAEDVISLAETYYGIDYLYGAKAGRTDVFDCSSLTQYVFWKNGIKLKRASRPQFLYDGDKVLRREELRKGDLVFFSTAGTAKKYNLDDYQRNGHVGIVKEIKKNGEIIFIHTYKKGIGVTDSKMKANQEKGWWNRHFLYGKRVIADDGSEAPDIEVKKEDIHLFIKK